MSWLTLGILEKKFLLPNKRIHLIERDGPWDEDGIVRCSDRALLVPLYVLFSSQDKRRGFRCRRMHRCNLHGKEGSDKTRQEKENATIVMHLQKRA